MTDTETPVSSPHTRGDGPCAEVCRLMGMAFSPHAWGWSGDVRREVSHQLVLATRVGMVRAAGDRPRRAGSSPHTRGDGPRFAEEPECPPEFSPHAWGWSVFEHRLVGLAHVLPTRVGMVRSVGSLLRPECCSPHTRGDGPSRRTVLNNLYRFSPHAWGWSGGVRSDPDERPVLPTRVGMVRPSGSFPQRVRRSPHTRGDGPS